MKKTYIAPESEYINFENDDVLTSVQPLGNINDYTNTSGEVPDTDAGIVSMPDVVSPFV